MRKVAIIHFICVATMLVVPSLLVAQEQGPVEESSVALDSAALEEAQWSKIRELKTIYEQAVSNNELSILEPHLADSFSAAMLTGKEIRSFQEMKQYNDEIKGMIGPGGSYNLDVTYAPGYMAGDIAITHGSTKEHVHTSDGKNYNFNSLWTAVLQDSLSHCG